jgi:hypothetical protein
MGRCLSLLAAMIASISCKFPNPLPTAYVQPGAGFQGLGSHDVGAHVFLYGGAKLVHEKSMMKLRGGFGDGKIPGEEKLQEEEEEEEERLDGVGPWWTTSEGVKLPDDADELYDTGIPLSPSRHHGRYPLQNSECRSSDVASHSCALCRRMQPNHDVIPSSKQSKSCDSHGAQ